MIFSCQKSAITDEDNIFDGTPDSDLDPVLAVKAVCENGFADGYPCNDYDLVAHLDLAQLSGVGIEGNDCWGWTDPLTQKEYVLMGTARGTVFVSIEDPVNPLVLGELRTHTSNSIWRDVKVYNNHAFIVSEADGHGMQVFDLTRLREITSTPVNFTADAHYDGFGNAHNIVINEITGFACAVGTSTFSGGPHFIDISDPKNPSLAGGFSQGAYSHDAQVISYNGPDSDYTGKEIFIGSNENKVVIVDVSDKNNPALISEVFYGNVGYTHQGWFTEDMKYFILGDELDELNFGNNTRTIVFDLSDLDNPTFHMSYIGPTAAIDHNGYVKDNIFYLANYTAGVRMIDIANIRNNEMTEVGFFDTYKPSNGASFNGVWNVYPYFESGNIAVSDSDSGLFIIRKSEN